MLYYCVGQLDEAAWTSESNWVISFNSALSGLAKAMVADAQPEQIGREEEKR